MLHETSKAHVEASLKIKLKRTTLPLIPSLIEAKKANVITNREIVKQLIDITLFLSQHCLPFRGHREAWTEVLHGNFKDLVLLLAKHTPLMAGYVSKLQMENKKISCSFITWRRQNQLIEAISSYILSRIKLSLKEAPFFSISIDTTFDISRKEQVSFIIRYADDCHGKVYERLIAMKNTPSTTGRDLATLFKDVCQENNLNWKQYLVGQTYDGAANMKGEYNGLQSIIKSENPMSVYVWCWAHRLNLIVIDIVSGNIKAQDLFGNLEKIFVFICSSKKKVSIYEENQKKRYPHQQIKRVKRVSTTRWMSHSYALNTVLETLDALLDTLEEIRSSQNDRMTCSEAGGLFTYFTSQNFLYTAWTFKQIFDILSPLNSILQSVDLDILAAMDLVNLKKKGNNISQM